MSGRLLAYQLLERAMLDLDVRHDPRADEIRDLLDPIWRALTPEEIACLDARDPAPQSVLAADLLPYEAVRVMLPGLLIPTGQVC